MGAANLMGGVRLGGIAVVTVCSPPFSGAEGSGGDGDVNIYRACVGDSPGLATMISNFSDGAATIDDAYNPVLSPDRTKILFEGRNAASASGYTEIWVVSSTPGSTPTLLLSDASNYIFHPFWHPDSDQFTYIHGTAGKLITAGGGGVKKSSVSSPGTTTLLKTSGGGKSPYRPQFSPDGTKIAYVFDTDLGGTGELRVMNADGSSDASIDSAVRYRFTGPNFGWASDSSLIAYDDGGNSPNAAYVITPAGTGKTQLNSSGDAAGVAVRVSDRCFPPGDGYVILAATAGLFTGQAPTRCELDGSGSTYLNTLHGSTNQDYFRQVLVANNRIWFIDATLISSKLSSVALDGTDYRTDLTIDGVQMQQFGTGQGWYYN